MDQGIKAYCKMEADNATFKSMVVAYYTDYKCFAYDNSTPEVELLPGVCNVHPWNVGSYTKLIIHDDAALSEKGIAFIIIGVVVALMCGFFIFYYFKNKNRKEQDEEGEDDGTDEEESESPKSPGKSKSKKSGQEKDDKKKRKEDYRIAD